MMKKQAKTARRKPKAQTPGGFPAHKIDVRVGEKYDILGRSPR